MLLLIVVMVDMMIVVMVVAVIRVAMMVLIIVMVKVMMTLMLVESSDCQVFLSASPSPLYLAPGLVLRRLGTLRFQGRSRKFRDTE